MRFSDEFLNEIRERLPVSEVVGRRVKLRKQGREWAGLSPFGQEKTPSFFVNDHKGFYHDFSANRHGDIFKFLMETEGLSFPEAVERLAQQAGVPLPAQSHEAEESQRRQRSLIEVVELAADFFQARLASKDGDRARAYLARREISTETQKEFRLGFAPSDRSALKQHLGSKGIGLETMIEAGLLVSGDDVPIPFDRFRDRLIIPIQDGRGRVIGFGGRALSDGTQPKYLNSPETSFFHKGTVVFNLHRAKEPAFTDGSVVVVEGYLDAITVYQGGLKSVVATMGTAFTDDQIETLWRVSSEPIVCFDSDKAGLAAAHRSIDRILPLLRVGRSFRFAFLREGKDPDELIREKGIAAFHAVLQGSLPLWDVLWERELSKAHIGNPDGRAELEAKLYSLVATIKDPTVNRAYHRTARIDLSDLFWQQARPAAKRKGTKEKGEAKLSVSEVRIRPQGYRRGIQEILLGMLVHCPDFIDEKSDQIALVDFDDRLERFRRALYNLLFEYGTVSVELIYSQLGSDYYEVLREIHGEAKERATWGQQLFRRFPIMKLNPPRDFVSQCIDHFVHILHLGQMKKDLAETAENRGRDDDIDASSERLLGLVRQLEVEQAQMNVRDGDLADWAKEIRTLASPNAPGLSLLAA